MRFRVLCNEYRQRLQYIVVREDRDGEPILISGPWRDREQAARRRRYMRERRTTKRLRPHRRVSA